MKSKFLSLCGCLFLAAVFALGGAAGGIIAYRQFADALVPNLARQVAEQLKIIRPAGKADTVEFTKAIPTPVPAEKVPDSDSRQTVALPLYYWDLDQVMKQSTAGKALSNYAVQYAHVMASNAETLRKALKKDDKSAKAEEARAMIAQFEKRQAAAESDARAFVRRLVAKELQEKQRFVRAYIVEKKDAFTFAPVSADLSTYLIERLNEISLTLPQLPNLVDKQHNNVILERQKTKE